MTQHTPPDYQQLFHMRAKLARLRIQSAAIEREQKRVETVNQIRVVIRQAPVVQVVKAHPVLRYQWPIGPCAMGNPFLGPPITIGKIQEEVCEQFKVTLTDLVSSRRNADIILPRHFAIWRCRRETTRSLPEIGRRFGGRDHTTCLSAIRRIDRLIAQGKLTERGEEL